MRTQIAKKTLLLAIGLLVLIGLAAVACTGGISQKEYDAAAAEAKAKAQEVAQLQKQLASTAPTTVIQVGQLQPVTAGAQLTGWDTKESIRGAMGLLAKYDSSGSNAWDPAKHPTVFFTSEGQSKAFSPGKNKLPGLMVIDAYTKEVVASALYDLGATEYRDTSHVVGVSPDGKWAYIHATVGRTRAAGTQRLLIINARTLKLDTLLTTTSEQHGDKRFHHVTAFKDWLGRDRVLVQNQHYNGPKYILDPNDNHRVVKVVTSEDVGSMGHPYGTVDPTGKFLYVALATPERVDASIAKVNLETGAIIRISGVGKWPIGMAFTSDGKYTYVNDADDSLVYKIDNATNTVVGHTSGGVVGGYGMALNWDETELWIIGKGEGSHNRGGVVAVIDTKTFTPFDTFNQPIYLGGSASSIDHGILHPDPKVNELWVSNMNGWETIVVDLNTKKVKAYIPTPHGGDTHSGAFVRYNPDFTGELLVDMGGPQKAMYAAKRALIAAAK